MPDSSFASTQDAGTVVPQPEHVADILSFGRQLSAHTHLLVHCHAGVSRSTAAMTLILAQAVPDVPADRIFGEVLRIRPQAWPNLRRGAGGRCCWRLSEAAR
jgi:predicted protein tyrosine phosphatase